MNPLTRLQAKVAFERQRPGRPSTTFTIQVMERVVRIAPGEVKNLSDVEEEFLEAWWAEPEAKRKEMTVEDWIQKIWERRLTPPDGP